MLRRSCTARFVIAFGILASLLARPAHAADAAPDPPPQLAPESGRLLAMAGVTQIEGAGGGGLVPWALITGYGTRDAVGGNVHYTFVHTGDFDLHSAGAAIGLYDRVEVSFARQWFDTRAVGGKLGLDKNHSFDQDIVGLKVRWFGDAVYEQESWLPQVAVGAQYKSNNRSPAHASTLYDQLGAKPGLEKLVDRAVEIFTTDPRIAALFEDSNLDRHKRMLVELFCQLSGGGCVYTGHTMVAAHKGLHLNTDSFNALVEDLKRAMDQSAIPFSTQNRLLALLAPMYRDVVTK